MLWVFSQLIRNDGKDLAVSCIRRGTRISRVVYAHNVSSENTASKASITFFIVGVGIFYKFACGHTQSYLR